MNPFERALAAGRRPAVFSPPLTATGRQTLERARRLALQVEDEVLGGLSAIERRRMISLLQRALDKAPAQSPWRSDEGD